MRDFKLLIGGRLVEGDLVMDVINPATEAVLARCPRGSRRQFDEAIAAAKAAFPSWSRATIEARRDAVNAMANAVEGNAEELARLLTQEQGKPLARAKTEVAATVMFIRYFAGLNLNEREIKVGRSRHARVQRRPLGVVASIVPWNFPLLQIVFKVPAALITGNTVVLKPAPTTPLTALRFGELVAPLLPPGVLNIVTDANDLGSVLTSHPDVSKVSFTGSTATGRKVMASGAETLKRLTLELGGNDAAIVLDEVDPKAVAPGIFEATFSNSGQVCLAIKRLYVHDSIYDSLCAELAALAQAAVVGDGLEQGTTHGPLQNLAQFEKVSALIAEARTQGRIIAGGRPHSGRGYFIPPTIVCDIKEGTRLVDEEQFGPVLPIIRYSDPEDALERVNASGFGLGGSVWSSNVERAAALAARIEAGSVWVNGHAILTPHVPFSGAKQSGIGTELGEEALAEFTQLHVLNRPN